jgi:hypothetical protein
LRLLETDELAKLLVAEKGAGAQKVAQEMTKAGPLPLASLKA